MYEILFPPNPTKNIFLGIRTFLKASLCVCVFLEASALHGWGNSNDSHPCEIHRLSGWKPEVWDSRVANAWSSLSGELLVWGCEAVNTTASHPQVLGTSLPVWWTMGAEYCYPWYGASWAVWRFGKGVHSVRPRECRRHLHEHHPVPAKECPTVSILVVRDRGWKALGISYPQHCVQKDLLELESVFWRYPPMLWPIWQRVAGRVEKGCRKPPYLLTHQVCCDGGAGRLAVAQKSFSIPWSQLERPFNLLSLPCPFKRPMAWPLLEPWRDNYLGPARVHFGWISWRADPFKGN